MLGVSRDSIATHERFKEQQGFNFEVLSDQDEKAGKAYAVIKDETMHGKKVRGMLSRVQSDRPPIRETTTVRSRLMMV